MGAWIWNPDQVDHAGLDDAIGRAAARFEDSTGFPPETVLLVLHDGRYAGVCSWPPETLLEAYQKTSSNNHPKRPDEPEPDKESNTNLSEDGKLAWNAVVAIGQGIPRRISPGDAMRIGVPYDLTVQFSAIICVPSNRLIVSNAEIAADAVARIFCRTVLLRLFQVPARSHLTSQLLAGGKAARELWLSCAWAENVAGMGALQKSDYRTSLLKRFEQQTARGAGAIMKNLQDLEWVTP